MNKCNKCGYKFSSTNKSGFCKRCYVRKVIEEESKPKKRCKDCNCDINSNNESFLCRICYLEKYESDPKNIKRKSERSKKWARENPERHREKSLNWQRNNPDRVKEIRFKTMSGLNNKFTRAVWRAKRRGFDWNIKKEDYSYLVKSICHYCSGPLEACGVGLDRIDNKKGYILGNIVPCCGTCNKIKGDRLTSEEMLVAMTAVLELRKKIKEESEWQITQKQLPTH